MELTDDQWSLIALCLDTAADAFKHYAEQVPGHLMKARFNSQATEARELAQAIRATVGV